MRQHALFEMGTTEVLERFAEGDLQTVLRNIADPIERWEAERKFNKDALHDNCGSYRDEDMEDNYTIGLLDGEGGLLAFLAEAIPALGSAVEDAWALRPSERADRLRSTIIVSLVAEAKAS